MKRISPVGSIMLNIILFIAFDAAFVAKHIKYETRSKQSVLFKCFHMKTRINYSNCPNVINALVQNINRGLFPFCSLLDAKLYKITTKYFSRLNYRKKDRFIRYFCYLNSNYLLG